MHSNPPAVLCAAARLGAFALGAVLFAAAPGHSQLPLVPVDLAVPAAPVAVQAAGRTQLAYELHVTNLSRSPLLLEKVEVLDPQRPGSPLASYAESELTARLLRPGAPRDLPDKRQLGPGMRAVVFLWLTAEPGRVPVALRHRLSVQSSNEAGATAEQTVEGLTVAIVRDAPLVLAPPLRSHPGDRWVAANGPSNTSGHRRTLIPIDGRARIPQRFAIDWGKLGDDGKLMHGDPAKNASYYGYGTEVLAVADGRVAAIKDGIAENVPLATERAVAIDLETVGGNFVALDLSGGQGGDAGGLYAFYAHLQPGSLRVKAGDRVRRGQVLGLLGNSGNSDLPHLHFHLSDSPTPLGGEGRPYVFARFEQLGTVPSLDDLLAGSWTPAASETPQTREAELPLENAVVRFP